MTSWQTVVPVSPLPKIFVLLKQQHDRPVAPATDVLAELAVLPRARAIGGGVFD